MYVTTNVNISGTWGLPPFCLFKIFGEEGVGQFGLFVFGRVPNTMFVARTGRTIPGLVYGNL